VGTAVLGVLAIGFLLFQSAVRGGWECETLLTPGPAESVTPRPATPSPTLAPPLSPAATGSPAGSPASSPVSSPASSPVSSPATSPVGSPASSPQASPTSQPTAEPEPTARLGFTTSNLGRTHILDPGHVLNFGFCPPTSGEHFNITGQGPIRPLVYDRTDERNPGGWIHNLEHGFVVALYRCPSPDDCPSEAEMSQLQAFFDQAPFSGNEACPKKVLVARLDDMTTRFALVAWNRALLLDEFDLDTALTFAKQWTSDEAAPERNACL
jgi:hypothetical protein